MDFFLYWANYTAGFGDISHEHWLGLNNIYAITNNGKTYQLRVDLDDGFETDYAMWGSFKIKDEANGYQLSLLGYYYRGGGKLNL